MTNTVLSGIRSTEDLTHSFQVVVHTLQYDAHRMFSATHHLSYFWEPGLPTLANIVLYSYKNADGIQVILF